MRRTIPTGTPEDDRSRIIERPDGFYWRYEDGRSEYGPFDTLVEAVADMQAPDEDGSYEPGESLAEAEDEIGIADYKDPETGELAEEQRTRLEDH